MRPLQDWLMVKMDPIPEKVGSLFTVHGDRIRTGMVLEVGPGAYHSSGKRIPIGVEKGERIAFFRENLEHQQGKQIVTVLSEIGDDLGLLRVADVLFVISSDANIRVSG